MYNHGAHEDSIDLDLPREITTKCWCFYEEWRDSMQDNCIVIVQRSVEKDWCPHFCGQADSYSETYLGILQQTVDVDCLEQAFSKPLPISPCTFVRAGIGTGGQAPPG